MSHRTSFIAGAAALIGAALVGCGGSESTPARDGSPAISTEPAQNRPIVVGCEGITPTRGWRHQTTSVANFALFVKHVASQVNRLSNGNDLVKAGAAVVGDRPVTLRVPPRLEGTVGLVYGAGIRHHRGPEKAPTEVTFRPCRGRPRSGYVGGLIFRGAVRPITLRVRSAGSFRPLRLVR
jgi:hypothetical protein